MDNTSGMDPIYGNVGQYVSGYWIKQNTLPQKPRLNNVASKDTFSTHLRSSEEFKELECKNGKNVIYNFYGIVLLMYAYSLSVATQECGMCHISSNRNPL